MEKESYRPRRQFRKQRKLRDPKKKQQRRRWWRKNRQKVLRQQRKRYKRYRRNPAYKRWQKKRRQERSRRKRIASSPPWICFPMDGELHLGFVIGIVPCEDQILIYCQDTQQVVEAPLHIFLLTAQFLSVLDFLRFTKMMDRLYLTEEDL